LRIIVFTTVFSVFGCTPGPRAERNSNKIFTENAANTTDSKVGDSVQGGNAGSGTQGKGDGNDRGPIDASGQGRPDPNFDHQSYFSNVVEPLFEDGCRGCHVGPRVDTPIRGPLSIFEHKSVALLLTDGNKLSFDSSSIGGRLLGKLPHSGGVKCASMADSPCKELGYWLVKLGGNLDAGEGVMEQFVAAIRDTSPSGEIYGYAVDPLNKDQFLIVEFLRDGLIIGDTVANLIGFDDFNGGNHAFKFTIPEFTSGEAMDIQVEIKRTEGNLPFDSSPLRVTAYSPQEEGRQVFQNGSGQFAQCSGCHNGTYQSWYSSLLSPPPDKGGTITTNLLYRKASNSIGHAGGNRCGGGVCDVIQDWWQAEFQ